MNLRHVNSVHKKKPIEFKDFFRIHVSTHKLLIRIEISLKSCYHNSQFIYFFFLLFCSFFRICKFTILLLITFSFIYFMIRIDRSLSRNKFKSRSNTIVLCKYGKVLSDLHMSRLTLFHFTCWGSLFQ